MPLIARRFAQLSRSVCLYFSSWHLAWTLEFPITCLPSHFTLIPFLLFLVPLPRLVVINSSRLFICHSEHYIFKKYTWSYYAPALKHLSAPHYLQNVVQIHLHSTDKPGVRPLSPFPESLLTALYQATPASLATRPSHPSPDATCTPSDRHSCLSCGLEYSFPNLPFCALRKLVVQGPRPILTPWKSFLGKN